MSMNFSEFKRMLGAEPRSRDPELMHARESAPEFEAAAVEAEQFETGLERAVMIPTPDGLLEDLKALSQQPVNYDQPRRWWPMALAASVLMAVGAAGLTWNLNQGWDSVEDNVMDHYRHDGSQAITLAGTGSAGDVQALLAELDVQALPALAGIVGVIKNCPTPDGKGIHMILNTESGPVTVFYMPETRVKDRENLAFDGINAILVELQRGSAAIIGPDQQLVSSLHDVIQDSLIPISGKS